MSLAAELPKEMQAINLKPLFIFRIAVNKPSVIGQTPSIDRRVGEITGGTFKGERLRGKSFPAAATGRRCGVTAPGCSTCAS